jgi:hypothetical protein
MGSGSTGVVFTAVKDTRPAVSCAGWRPAESPAPEVPISSGARTDKWIGYGTIPAFDCGYVFHDPLGNPTAFLSRELADLGMTSDSDIQFVVSYCGATMDNYRDFTAEALGGSIVLIGIAILVRRRHNRRLSHEGGQDDAWHTSSGDRGRE